MFSFIKPKYSRKKPQKSLVFIVLISSDLDTMLGIMIDTITNRDIDDKDLQDVKEALTYEFEQTDQEDTLILTDKLHKQAWPNDPIGNPVYIEPELISNISKDMLIHYMKQQFVGSKMVVAGTKKNMAIPKMRLKMISRRWD
jgi:predicted Zn-dependent peptidase